MKVVALTTYLFPVVVVISDQLISIHKTLSTLPSPMSEQKYENATRVNLSKKKCINIEFLSSHSKYNAALYKLLIFICIVSTMFTHLD